MTKSREIPGLQRVLMAAIRASEKTPAELMKLAGLNRSTYYKMMAGEHAGSLRSWDKLLLAAQSDLIVTLRYRSPDYREVKV